MNKALVKEQFGANAAAYVTSKVHAKGASLARLVELVQPQPAWRALDIATAAGHTAFTFAPHVAHVTATDITPEMLVQARRLGQEKDITNVTFEEADAEDLPFAAESFDLVTCRIAPHHFPNIPQFIAESVRVLRPGGILAVVDNVSPDDDSASDYYNAFEKLRDPSHGRCWGLTEWRDAFVEAGLTVLAEETAPKEMEFDWWADRLGVSVEDTTKLRAMLLDAPPTVQEFLQPARRNGDLLFYLTEAILIGRKE